MTVTDHEVRARKVRSVAIIGGGASGAIVLDSLVQEQQFDEIVLYERRGVLGGVWVLDENPDELDVPPGLDQEQLDPPLPVPEFEVETREKRHYQQRYLHTASYKGLRTNIPELLMTYSDLKKWDAQDDERVEEEYVRGVVVQRYIETYLKRNEDKIVLNTSVESVKKDYTKQDSQFELTLRTDTGEVDEDGHPVDLWSKRTFDAVVVATGHYHVPSIPDVPGIQDVYHKFPGVIVHSKTFRTADQFQGKKIIVVGSRSSGADVVELGAKYAAEIIQSKRSSRLVRPSESPNVITKPVITRYEVSGGDIIVHFEDGTTTKNPDSVVYATGFRYSFPFLKNSFPSFTTGYVMPDLYQHTFYNKDPLLSLVGVPTDAISFRAFEYQAVLVSRFLARKVVLPPLEEQIRWSLARFHDKGDARAFHTIDWGKKFDYLGLLTHLGGGSAPIGGTGRAFPVPTQDEIDLHDRAMKKLAAFFSLDREEALESFKTDLSV